MAAHQFDVTAHGRKRPAEGELDDQPLAKKFGRLKIESLNVSRLPGGLGAKDVPQLHHPGDAMMLDDTDTTVYIHDLDQELTESDTLDRVITILPGLEDKLPIPKLLVGNNKHQCRELVVYKEPESLTVPKDKDQVRRALIETRERARLGLQPRLSDMVRINGPHARHGTDQNSGHAKNLQKNGSPEDEMDIDTEG
ncbi:hypothetical protein ASPVEDRAFT_79412 [Aspergillus versicolor CBS 583.65]|uniref:Uncharacterized protein n=1 Tax=Aspergillus versicolor CBS 583.65 TaxID=1036611 RepID=A0A1L9P899_ASPVE|nr:uncharacterized protein ASPVEDRAFT_79412 [Aspergillus versicolor CBS 583.65]OJI97716.1 hypothetical protein ASPVEDRAFT_79412 [Aspergillus versicolor CBS 583.65]